MPDKFYNTIMVTGRLGQKPTLKYFESGSVVSEITLGEKRRVANEPEGTNWFRVELWGGLAEMAANYLDKGSQIAIKGELRLERWQDKATGKERFAPKIRATGIEILSSKRTEQIATEAKNIQDDDWE